MSKEKMYLREGFFKFLVSLEELKEKKERIIFVNSIGITDDQLSEFADYLLKFEIKILIDDDYIFPLLIENQKIHLDLNISEWLALQASTEIGKDDAPYFQKIIKNKVEEVQKNYSRYNLFKKKIEQNIATTTYDVDTNLTKKIDFYIIKRNTILITFNQDRKCEIFPLRLVYLDSVLCVIGENVLDKTLCYFSLQDIATIEGTETLFNPNISQIEVSEFISHLRLINGNEERLILKIYSANESNFLPNHHFLGNPYVTSNPEGDMIWAASLEMCDDVFQWLYSMQDRVEILDPGHIRKEFFHYCELKKENSSTKKAS